MEGMPAVSPEATAVAEPAMDENSGKVKDALTRIVSSQDINEIHTLAQDALQYAMSEKPAEEAPMGLREKLAGVAENSDMGGAY